MKSPMFRCVKVVFEEKKTYTVEPEPATTTEVSVQFELVGNFGNFGYAHLTMTVEQFKESGYRVGQVYALSPT